MLEKAANVLRQIAHLGISTFQHLRVRGVLGELFQDFEEDLLALNFTCRLAVRSLVALRDNIVSEDALQNRLVGNNLYA